MSWIACKVAGLDNEDQKQVINEYFQHKTEDQELKKFWEEYEDEYFTGGDRNDG